MKALLKHVKVQIENTTLVEVFACLGVCAVVVILLLHIINGK